MDENEPLFSADDEEEISGDGANAKTELRKDGQDSKDNIGSNIERQKNDIHAVTHFPPPKYLQSTYASREAEFELDPEVIQDEESELHGVPAMQGLLGNAAHRGSIEVRRDARNTQSLNCEDEDELVVGGGQGSIMASVSSVTSVLA